MARETFCRCSSFFSQSLIQLQWDKDTLSISLNCCSLRKNTFILFIHHSLTALSCTGLWWVQNLPWDHGTQYTHTYSFLSKVNGQFTVTVHLQSSRSNQRPWILKLGSVRWKPFPLHYYAANLFSCKGEILISGIYVKYFFLNWKRQELS